MNHHLKFVLIYNRSDGSISVVETVPDTVTQWMGNAFCASTTDGIGISNITLLTSFQPFFLSMNLPYSVIRGEVVSLIVTVFNYLHHCTAVSLHQHTVLNKIDRKFEGHVTFSTDMTRHY